MTSCLSTGEEVKQELRGAALGALVALASGKESAAQEDDDDLMAQAELNPKDPLPVTPAAADARERVRKAYPVSTAQFAEERGVGQRESAQCQRNREK